MSMLGVGCGPQVGPFPSRPIMGSIRGEGTPPTQTLAIIWRNKGAFSLSSGCSRKIKEGDQPPPPPPPPPPHHYVPPPPLALVTGSPCADIPTPPPPPLDRCATIHSPPRTHFPSPPSSFPLPSSPPPSRLSQHLPHYTLQIPILLSPRWLLSSPKIPLDIPEFPVCHPQSRPSTRTRTDQAPSVPSPISAETRSGTVGIFPSPAPPKFWILPKSAEFPLPIHPLIYPFPNDPWRFSFLLLSEKPFASVPTALPDCSRGTDLTTVPSRLSEPHRWNCEGSHHADVCGIYLLAHLQTGSISGAPTWTRPVHPPSCSRANTNLTWRFL